MLPSKDALFLTIKQLILQHIIKITGILVSPFSGLTSIISQLKIILGEAPNSALIEAKANDEESRANSRTNARI